MALLQPLQMGSLLLKNRIVLASMTRNRSPGAVPGSEVVNYYEQRSGGGLLLTEGTFIVPIGSEWPQAPCIYDDSHVKGWRKVTAAVHAKGSKIFVQLWHIGRVAHPLHQMGLPALSPSGIGAKGGKFRLLDGHPGYVENPAIIEDPWKIIEEYRNAAKNAYLANFDGVELHAANGYLPAQFIEAHSNKRTDEWGGSAEKRAKFVLEAVKVLIEVMGDSKKVGIKLSPCGGYNDMGDPKDILLEEYTYLIKELDKLNIGYIQLMRYDEWLDGEKRGTPLDVIGTFAPLIKNALIVANGSYTPEEAEKHVSSGLVSAVAFGRPYIANPDLAERIKAGKALETKIDFATLYNPPPGQPLAVGYTDYPTA